MRVYVSGEKIGVSIDKEDLQDAFGKFGNLTDVWVARQPPGFAFVTFEDYRDGEDAIRDMTGKEILGCPIRVEESRGKGGRRPAPDRGDGGGYGRGGGSDRYGGDRYGGGGGGGSNEECADFRRGLCNRGSGCRYSHGDGGGGGDRYGGRDDRGGRDRSRSPPRRDRSRSLPRRDRSRSPRRDRSPEYGRNRSRDRRD
mmetsp:Transcript_50094/g.113699  ORF Transcript_50094/g.113699 Transcript_50094/m.113699 type:complete len:198 (-) Transcript_50094:230-823(-)